MPRRVHYPRAQKWRVVETVKTLARKYRRPVCSADLRTHYREHPDEHPLLLQPLGLVLQKVARPCPDRAIVRAGIIGKHCYYGPDNTRFWKERLEAHRLEVQGEKEIVDDLPRAVSLLLSSEVKRSAENALAGFAKYWGAIVTRADLKDWHQLEDLQRLVDAAKTATNRKFRWVAPLDLLSRRDAGALLQEEYGRRADAEHELSLYRHLAELGRLGASDGIGGTPGTFSKLQIRWYAESKWCWDPLQREYARGMVHMLHFGSGGFPLPAPPEE